MKVAFIKPLGGGLYLIAPVSAGHPDHELPGLPPEVGGGPVVPPGTWPPPGHPDHDLPTIPGVPDNSLPTTPPPTVPPGTYLVIGKGQDGKWKWATVTTPPMVLPEPMPTPPMAPGGVPQPKA